MTDTAAPEPRRHFANSVELRSYVRENHGSRVLLSFSTGKDSIAAWIALQESGFEVVPFYLYMVPGLEFVEESLGYYERFFQVRIHRFPSPLMLRILRGLVYQPPERAADVEALATPSKLLRFDGMEDEIRKALRMPDDYTANGVRAADSVQRALACKKNGVLHHKRRSFYPVFDWKMDDVVASLERARIKLPVDYRLFGRTFEGLQYQFLAPVRKHFPRDYARILEFFPLADLDLFRRGKL